jgi:HlyD family secretion protein
MTATVQFQTGSADNVLAVPNAALRIKPTADMLAAAGLGTQASAPRDSTARPASGTTRPAGQARTGMARSGSGGTLWTIDSAGKVKPMRVRIGLTDGQKTEVQGAALSEGTQVIVSVGGATTSSTTSAATTANPFQPQRPGGPGRGF